MIRQSGYLRHLQQETEQPDVRTERIPVDDGAERTRQHQGVQQAGPGNRRLPLADKKVKKAVLFKNGTPVRFTKNKEGVLLEFTEIPKDIDYVVELTID